MRGSARPGSHKPNTAIDQAFYCREEGVKRITTETGAGQWGSSLALAGSMFGLEIEVFMVRVSYDQKPYRRAFMESFGATCHASPSNRTESGKTILADTPDSTGSLGIAISEAVECAAQRDDTKYALGSVLNHVLMHQTVVGQEALRQMEMADDYPDVVIGCTGGGSNFAGLAFPFIGRKLRAEQTVRVVAVEPANCPSLTRGQYAYDFGDTGNLTPLVKMHTLGSAFVPPGFHAGGLRYHGMAPLVSQLVNTGEVEAVAPINRSSALRPVSSLPRQKVFCRHLKRTTRSKAHSTKRCAARQKALREPFYLTFADMAISICRPTATLPAANYMISPMTNRKSP